MHRHNAPPVVYPVGRSRFLGTALLALWLAGLLAALFWLHGMAQFDWRTGVAFSAVIGAGVAVRSGWKHTPSGQLAWDGEAWRWDSPSYRTCDTEQELSVVADFQHVLLLRAENHKGASLWVWLERSTMPERWLAVRRAVYSPHRSAVAVQHDVLSEESSALPALPALPVLAVSAPSVARSAAVTRIKP